MLIKLRENMKLIMWILLVAFLITIIFSWGAGGCDKQAGMQSGVLGKIAGTEISMEEFDYLIERQRLTAEQSGEEFDVQKTREETWDNQVEAILKRDDLQRLKLGVTDIEIVHIIENFPPNEIRQVEAFQTDGQFDIRLYQRYLREPQAAQFLIRLEENVRNYLLDQNLNFHVSQAVDVTEEEIRDEYLRVTAMAQFRFIFVPFSETEPDSSEITEEMMLRYYNMFPDRYIERPTRRFAYVYFKLESSEQDASEISREASNLMTELRAITDSTALVDHFAELAGLYSQDAGSAALGGDLGWFGRGKMVKEFNDAAFEAEPGSLVGPIKTKFGYHIILVEGHQGQSVVIGDSQDESELQDSIKARHILLKIEPSADTRDVVLTEAYNFSQEAVERDFAEVAAQNEYRVDTTEYFGEAGYIRGRLGRMRMAAEFCFDNPVGAISGVHSIGVTDGTPKGYVVFKIVGATEETYKPFKDVRDRIHKSLRQIISKHRATDIAAELRGRIETADDLNAVAAASGYTVYETADSLKATGTLPAGLKSDRDFMTEAFRLLEGNVSDVIEGRNGCYIVYMAKKTQFIRQDYNAQHPMIYQTLITKKQTAVMANWVRELRIAGGLQDWRYRYYRDF